MIDLTCNSAGYKLSGSSFGQRPNLFLFLVVLTAVFILMGVSSPVLALSNGPTALGIPTAPPPNAEDIEAAPLPPAPSIPPPLSAPSTPLPLPGPTLPGQAGATHLDTLPGQADPSVHGLGNDIWQGSDTRRLVDLLSRLPAPISVPALSGLQQSLLLSPSREANSSVDPLLSARSEKLHEMGFDDGAADLGATLNDSLDLQRSVENALLANDINGACQQVDRALEKVAAPSLFFQRATIFCQIMRKQNDPASLGLDLLRERNDQDSTMESFIALAALANGETKRVPQNVVAPDPLNIALMKTVGLAVPAMARVEAAAPSGIGSSVIITRDETRALPQRVAAAEQAFRFSLISADELSNLYLQMPAGISDPATAIGMSDSIELRAQLYQSAYRYKRGTPAAVARVVDAALKKAQQRGDYINQVQLYAPLMRDIVPSRELAFFAPQAARLLFVTGQPEKAGYWLNTIAANPKAFTRPGEKEGLDLLGHLAGLPSNGDPVGAWAKATGIINPRVELFYALISGLNQDVASPVMGGFQAAPMMMPGSMAAEIVAAAAGQRKGEAITLSLIGIGGDNAIAVDPGTMVSALRSLIQLGLKQEARRIALEVAVLAGL